MTTVQLAISNADYLRSLRSLLAQDGDHHVVVVDKPNPRVPGLIVVERDLLGDSLNSGEAERFVVIAPREAYFHLSQLWQAGFHHVVFERDPPTTAYLAVLAAELKLLAKTRHEVGNVGLRGPFKLTDDLIDAEVERTSPGFYLLSNRALEGAFHIVYVGRSDTDVNNQLHVHVGTYERFQYEYCATAQVAFEKECGYYHEHDPRDNNAHPRRAAGSAWKCPRCGG